MIEPSESTAPIVVLAADHNGVALKAEIVKVLRELGYKCVDLGPTTDEVKVDYPDYARAVAERVNRGDARFGVLVCGTGVGMSIVANRYPEVRAALVHTLDVAKKSREHNDANVLCIGAWVNPPEMNMAIVRSWFGEPFGEGRHTKRVAKTRFTGGI